jgi:hypothetical protein
MTHVLRTMQVVAAVGDTDKSHLLCEIKAHECGASNMDEAAAAVAEAA